MRKNNYWLLAILPFLFTTSCEKDRVYVDQKENLSEIQLKNQLRSFLDKNDDFISTSLTISSSSVEKDFIKEVHNNVSSSLSLGLDEVFYLSELVNDDQKINKGINRNLLKSSLNSNVIKSSKLMASNVVSNKSQTDIGEIIKKGDYNIYWPYSENWNGEESPAIVFLDEANENNLDVAALLPIRANGEVRYDTIIVNEEYAQQHPVWVLSKKSDVPYKDIPHLADGKRAKNGTYFQPAVNTDHYKSNVKKSVKASSSADNKVYQMKLGDFMAERHYDPWLKGGSEFYFLFTETATNSVVPGSGIGMSTQINRIFIDRPRKTIKNKSWVNVNQIAVSHWRPEVFKSALVIIEKDTDSWEPKDKDAEKINFDIPITYMENGKEKTTNLKGSFTIHKEDEFITTKNYDRNFIFSNGNNLGSQGWAKLSEGGLHWKLPTYIYTSNL